MNNQISSWSIIKVFFQSFAFYNSIEKNFKEKIKASNLDSTNKSIQQFESIIQFLDTKDIALLRDKYLVELRQLAHAEFRSRKKMERFDIYISEIFHEVSILKEQKFILEHYFQRKDQINPEEFNQMINQTYELFETKMEHIKILFNNAKGRLEEILPAYRNDDFILRTLYLEGSKLLKGFYKDPVKNMLDLMFVNGGFSEGYVAIACSFCSGGFFDHANKVVLGLKKDELSKLNTSMLALHGKLKLFLKDHLSDDNLAVTYQKFLSEINPDIILIKQI